MANWQIFKISRKTFFNPSAWLDTENLRGYTLMIWNIIRGVATPDIPVREESFAEAMKRLHLSEADVKRTERNYFMVAVMFVALAALTLVLSTYLLFYHFTFSGFLIGIAASLLFLGQAFRYHFWYFQIKNRKLGCTLKEWRTGKVHHKGSK